MKATRIFTTADGTSAFEDFDIPIKDSGEIGKLSEIFRAKGIIFRETDGDYDYQWHNAPERQFVIMLDGEVDITTGDGVTRRFSSGDILLAEDTTGQGHISKAVEGRSRKSLFIVLED
jgi:uncharacterized protein YjlB